VPSLRKNGCETMIGRYWTYLVQFFKMQITRASDYAVRVMVHLASLSEGKKVPLTALVHATGVKESFLSKVMQRLVHTGLVSSHRGTGGGFCLKVPPVRTTLLDVIEAIDGPLELNLCLGSGQGCNRQGWCGVYAVWREAQEMLSAVLEGVTIARLARATARDLSALETVSVGSGEPVVTVQVK
jgi:Rrf2 family protein